MSYAFLNSRNVVGHISGVAVQIALFNFINMHAENAVRHFRLNELISQCQDMYSTSSRYSATTSIEDVNRKRPENESSAPGRGMG